MKKVLIISYYWPPSGGIGVLRCLKIAKYLREFGWEPIVFTAKDAHYPTLDPSNDKDIPKDLTVLRQKIWEPYHIYKFITRKEKTANVNNVFYVKEDKPSLAHRLSVWIRSNFFIPDARAMWIRPSVKYLTQYLKDNPVDAIFSDGPPHSNTRIATLLKQKTGTPWLADFQDPWTQVDYYQLLSLTKWGDAKHRRMEQAAFKAADKITIVSPTWKRDLEELGAKNVTVIPWGFDPADYPTKPPKIVTSFAFTHLGIMGYDRNPATFFKVLSDLKSELADFGKHLKIRLVGQVDYSITESYTVNGLAENVEMIGSVPRQKALELTLSSPVLLLLLNQQSNAQGRIPGKLFEYLAARRPILTLGGTDSDVAGIIQTTKSGQTCDYEDYEAIKKNVKYLYNQYLAGTLADPVQSEIDQYSVKTLTGKIAGLLNDISRTIS